MKIDLEQIIKMSAGYEMDKLIAEVLDVKEFNEELHSLGQWNYSSDIYFAMELFIEMCDKGYLISIHRPKKDFYMLSIHFHEPIYISGDTLEEAIGRTVLFLHMIKQEVEQC